MSETPRTDKARRSIPSSVNDGADELIKEARKMERELTKTKAALSAAEQRAEGMGRDAARLDWLENSHYFDGAHGEQNESFSWKFYTPNNGRQWQPIRDKIDAAIASGAGDGNG